MISKKVEVVSAVLVVAILVGVPAWVIQTESKAASVAEGPNARVINLTAVAKFGIWTDEEVVGHSYWRRRPKVARPIIRLGETVVFRLKSADVQHSFAISELGIDPVPVKPGHVVEVRLPLEDVEPGEYIIQCSTWCGPCHEEMLGSIVVLRPNQKLEDIEPLQLPPREKCPLHTGDDS